MILSRFAALSVSLSLKAITIADIAKARGGEMLRALRRCKGADGRVMHSLDLYCDEPDGDGAPLGFVR